MTVENARNAAAIVFDADRALVGRTRLQKLGCLFELAGVGSGFSFSYHHYGPFSQNLALAIEDAHALNLVQENVVAQEWGNYSEYAFTGTDDMTSEYSEVRSAFSDIAKTASNVEFELAVTAAFIASRNIQNPWDEVRKRKPRKANSIPRAKQLYEQIKAVESPVELPVI